MVEVCADLDVLAAAGRGIATFVDELDRQPVDDIDCYRPAVGHGRLADTLASFCDRWQIGVPSLTADGKETARFLLETVREFGAVDEAGAQRLQETVPGG